MAGLLGLGAHLLPAARRRAVRVTDSAWFVLLFSLAFWIYYERTVFAEEFLIFDGAGR